MADARNARDRRSAPVVRRPEVRFPSANNDGVEVRVLHARPVDAAQRARGAARQVLVCVSRRDCLVLMPGVEAGARREGGATGTGTEGVATAGVGESVDVNGAIERPLRRSRNRNRRTRWYMAKAKGAYA